MSQETKQATAVLYARISRADRDADGTLNTDGVDRQIERLRDLAAQRGAGIVREIIENDVSASKGSRAGFLELLNILRDEQANMVIAFGVDRLARKRKDNAALLDVAQQKGVDLVLLNGADIAASTPAGRLVASVLGSVATAETETMALRLSEGYRQRAKRGSHVPRQRTFGYLKGNLNSDPEESALVQEIYSRIEKGDGLATICKDFARRGITSTKGIALTRQSLRVIATNPRYIGVCEYHQLERDSDGREIGRKLVSATTGTWQPIISKDLFDAVQAILNDPRRKRERPTVKHLLTGIAKCGECDAPLVRGRSSTGIMLTCPNSHIGRTAAPIDKAITALAIKRLASRSEMVLRAQDPGDPTASVAALESRQTELAAIFADGAMPLDAYAAASTALAERLDEAKAKAVEPSRDPLAGFPTGGESELAEAWDRTDILGRRRIIRELFEIKIDRIGRGRPKSPLAGVTVAARA